MKKFICITMLVFISGCGSFAARKDLRVDYHEKLEFSVNKPYQEVYRNFLEQVRGTYTFAWPGNRGIVENELYPDNNTATIRGTYFCDLTGEWLPMLIDIEASSYNRTKIMVYSSKHGFSSSINKETVEKWIESW